MLITFRFNDSSRDYTHVKIDVATFRLLELGKGMGRNHEESCKEFGLASHKFLHSQHPSDYEGRFARIVYHNCVEHNLLRRSKEDQEEPTGIEIRKIVR
jgi:hypothetical protein